METTGYCRFFDLVMKHIAGRTCKDENAELERIVGTNESMKREFERLTHETKLLVALHPLLEGVLATPETLPPTVRKHLQAGAEIEITLLNH